MEVTKEILKDFIEKDLRISYNFSNLEELKDSIRAVIEIPDSDKYGLVFSKLEKNNKLKIIEDNQLVTEISSSILFKTKEAPTYIINLLADYEGDFYSLVVTYNK